MPRHPSASLALLLATASLPAQQLRWQLDPYDSARYARQTQWREAILEPKGATLGAAAEVVPARTPLPGKSLLQNGGIEALNRSSPRGWSKRHYRGAGSLAVDRKHGRAGKHSLSIRGGKRIDGSWLQSVKVTPGTRYRLSGFIRADKVTRGGGAQLGIFELGKAGVTKAVSGTTDWVAVELEFDSGAHANLRVVCSLGAWQPSPGLARFDDISLCEIAGPDRKPTLHGALFRGARRPPVLRGRDLDPRRQYPDAPLTDLRDLPALLAFDLRRVRAATLKQQTANPRGFDPVWFEARYTALQEDGTQRIQVRLGSSAPRRRNGGRDGGTDGGKDGGKDGGTDGGKDVGGGQELDSRVSGAISIERRIDRVTQSVRSFSSEMELRVDLPKAANGGPLSGIEACALTCKETWTWRRDAAPNDSHFSARVNEAIRTGARSLRGEFGGTRLAAGKHALVVLTLLKAGEDPRDPMMQSLLNKVRRRGLTKTYDLAVSIMALEALYAPPDERDLLMNGRLQRPIPRKPSPEDLALMQEWVDTLLNNIDLRVDAGYLRRWNYTPAKRFDNSNSQYALLGLYTAELCGVQISPQVWFAAANHWLECQCRPEKSPIELVMVSYRELARRASRASWQDASSPRRTVTRGVPIKPRGWSYTSKGGKPTGSMTTAGITGLVICDAAMQAQEKGSRQLRTRMHEAIDAGFAWLARHFSVTGNPGNTTRWHYYYLYGLERACELNGTAIFHGRRWYTEGAELLLDQQRKDGAWASLEDTCFAILFLKKASPPVITGPR